MEDNTLIKAVEFKDLDSEELVEFIDSEKKTQVVSAETVPSKKNALHAVKETERAYEQGRNISHVPKIGFLIHLTGQRQIKDAINQAKVKGKKAVFICFNSNPGETWKEFKRKFDFKEREMDEASEEKVKEAMEKTSTFWID